MAVGTRRSDMEIIRDILRMDHGGTTELRFRANLSYLQLQKYLNFLEQSSLIELKRREGQVITFHVSDKGRQVLELLDAVFLSLGLDCLPKSGC